MEDVALHFQGIRSAHLLVTILAGVSLLLLLWGFWQAFHRRWMESAVCVAGALGPLALIPTLVVSGAVRMSRGQGGKPTILAAIGLSVVTLLAAMLSLHAGDSSGAFWMSLIGIQVASAVGIFYSAVYSYLGPRRISILMALRSAAIVALLLALFKPALSFTGGSDADKPVLPILVDRSASMSTIDEANLPSRYSQALSVLGTQAGRIQKHFRPVWLHFGSGVQTADGLETLGQLKPAGAGTDATNIAKAISVASKDYNRADLPGMLLLTDGLHNAGDNLIDAMRVAGVPVYCVGVGSTNEGQVGGKRTELLSAEAPMDAVKDNITNIGVTVRMTRLAGQAAEVQLLEENNQIPVAREKLWTDKNDDTVRATLKWTPKELPAPAGSTQPSEDRLRRLRLVVKQNPADPATPENSCELHVLVTQPRVRLLYVEGSMRPEYKFLRRLLDSDPNVQFVGLIRVSGNQFDAQGNVGGKTLTGLPATDDDFRMFDVIVIGDLDRTFMTNDQLARLAKFVKDGGGLAMLGGHNSFGPGGYGGTELEAALPVTMGQRAAAQETTRFLPQLTAAGETHAIFEGIKGYFPGPGGRAADDKLAKLPELLGCVTVVGPKPGASVLAVHPSRSNEAGALVSLAVQQYGAGRSVAFTADTTWQWFLPLKSMGADSPYERFWGQMIRWLANVQTKQRTQKPGVALRTERTCVQVGKPVRMVGRVQGDKTLARDATATVTVAALAADAGQQPQNVPMSFSPGSGLFECNLSGLKEGKYIVKMSCADSSGAAIGTDELPLEVLPHSAEMEHLARNADLLRALAEGSGGKCTELAGLPEMIDQIIDRQKGKGAAGPQVRTQHLYNFTALFLAFISLLTAEWLLRRNWQLH